MGRGWQWLPPFRYLTPMFYLTNNEDNTLVLYTGQTITTCDIRYTDLATLTPQLEKLTLVSQNDRYAELTWSVSATPGQYIVELVVSGVTIAAHVAYIADASGDPLEYNDYEFYEA